MNKKNERYADKRFRTTYKNPLSDIQARTFSDIKISSEFVPTSLLWTLFNDQHEVVIGTRGNAKEHPSQQSKRISGGKEIFCSLCSNEI